MLLDKTTKAQITADILEEAERHSQHDLRLENRLRPRVNSIFHTHFPNATKIQMITFTREINTAIEEALKANGFESLISQMELRS